MSDFMSDAREKMPSWHDWVEAPLDLVHRARIAEALGIHENDPALADVLGRPRFYDRVAAIVRAYYGLASLETIGPIDYADMPIVSLAPGRLSELTYYAGALAHAATIAARIDARTVATIRSGIGDGPWRAALAHRPYDSRSPDRQIDDTTLLERIEFDGRSQVRQWLEAQPDALGAWLRLGLFDGIDLGATPTAFGGSQNIVRQAARALAERREDPPI